AAFYIGMQHVKDQLSENEARIPEVQEQIRDMQEQGVEVPEWTWKWNDRLRAQNDRLHRDMRKFLWGEALAAGFVLIAPVMWLVTRRPKPPAWWFDAILPVGLGLVAVALLLAFYDRDWEFAKIRELMSSWSGDRFRIDEYQ